MARIKKEPALNALQAAQLIDCINAGRTVKVVPSPKLMRSALKGAPLFDEPKKQIKLW